MDFDLALKEFEKLGSWKVFYSDIYFELDGYIHNLIQPHSDLGFLDDVLDNIDQVLEGLYLKRFTHYRGGSIPLTYTLLIFEDTPVFIFEGSFNHNRVKMVDEKCAEEFLQKIFNVAISQILSEIQK
jgi:hypothetical protein